MSAIDKEPFPKGALIAMGAMVGLSLSATAVVRVARLSSPPPAVAAQPAPSQTAELRFADQSDGSISVLDNASGRKVTTLAPDTNGFVRGVMRGLARDRLSRHIGEAPPFRLSLATDGHLTLQDTATRRLIDLEAFGEGNRGAFLDILQAAETRT